MSHPENRSVAHRSSLQRPSWARPQSTTLIWDSVWFPGWMVIYGLEPLRSYRLINLRSNKKGWHLEYEPHHSASFPAQPALFARLFQPEWHHTKCINFVKQKPSKEPNCTWHLCTKKIYMNLRCLKGQGHPPIWQLYQQLHSTWESYHGLHVLSIQTK